MGFLNWINTGLVNPLKQPSFELIKHPGSGKNTVLQSGHICVSCCCVSEYKRRCVYLQGNWLELEQLLDSQTSLGVRVSFKKQEKTVLRSQVGCML